jgi:hypothetical protein
VVLRGIDPQYSFVAELFTNQKNYFMRTRRQSQNRKTPPVAILIRVFVVAVISLLAVACKKGDTGPAGATGPAGPAGPQGPVGTANVTYSNWFTPSAYTKDTVFGTWGFYHDEAATAITQAVLDSGLVITFGKLDGYVASVWPTNQVEALPIVITYMDGSSPNIDTWQALLTAGNLRIQLQSSLNAYGGISNAHQFRYVVIPGANKVTATSVKPGLRSGNGTLLDAATVGEVIRNHQQMGYAEICQRLGIPQ